MRKLGDIRARFNHLTLVVGDAQVVPGWAGMEAHGFPDDEVELDGGSVFVFDLNLLRTVVFRSDDGLRLVASFDGLGSTNVDEATLLAAAAEDGNPEERGTFDVTSGAMILSCADCVSPGANGVSTMVIPCENGQYVVSGSTRIGDLVHTRIRLV